MKQASVLYLERFFEEKEIQYEAWEIEHEEEMHFIDTDFIIAAIKEAPVQEKQKIANTLRKIDFLNGNVNHFLHFLAKQYIQIQY